MSKSSENPTYKPYLDEDGGRKGIFKWILSTDHKRIGLLYDPQHNNAFFRKAAMTARNNGIQVLGLNIDRHML